MTFQDAVNSGQFDQESVNKAIQYRETVKDALVDVLAHIDGAITEKDGKDYVNTEVLVGLVGVFAERGMDATMKGALLGDQRAEGASAVYSEVSTVLDVLVCIVKGISVT